jgi:hypothetical protein
MVYLIMCERERDWVHVVIDDDDDDDVTVCVLVMVMMMMVERKKGYCDCCFLRDSYIYGGVYLL